jgi:hypothetical protein
MSLCFYVVQNSKVGVRGQSLFIISGLQEEKKSLLLRKLRHAQKDRHYWS